MLILPPEDQVGIAYAVAAVRRIFSKMKWHATVTSPVVLALVCRPTSAMERRQILPDLDSQKTFYHSRMNHACTYGRGFGKDANRSMLSLP